MKSVRFLLSASLLVGCILHVLGGGAPMSVVVTLRGKKYDVKEATSVADVQKAVEEQAGLAKEQQSVLFKGNLLNSELELEDAGVADGDTVNVVPTKRPKTSAAAAAEKAFAVSASAGGEATAVPESSAATAGGGAGAGADPFGLGALGGLGGLGGLGAGMPPITPDQYRDMMKEMMNSDMMEEVLGNPEKMEQARQAILDNPTLKQAMAQLPGFSEMIESPEKWRENMEMALEMFKAQKAMLKMQQEQEQAEGAGEEGAADVDDLDDD